MDKKLMLLLASFFFGVVTLMAQKRVTGNVTDADGAPVIGATIKVNGTKVAAVTDAEGKFVLPNVPASAKTLSVSYIGMKTQEVSVSNNVSVVLAFEDELLDEAIVVAYGVAKKGSFTGSVSQMKAKDLQKMQVSNVSKGLEGQMAGVQITSATGQPGSQASINIRGIGSINSSSPLIVLDGVPYDGSLNSINQADIETMSVQKDASSTSIYGARAANGIIMITTKKGREGKTNVNFDAKWGYSDRGVKPYQTVRSEADYYELYWEAMRNQYLRNGVSMFDAGIAASQGLIKELGGYNAYDVADADLINPLTGRINPAAKLLYHDDWDDEPYNTGQRQEYNASISGGSDKTRYYVSLNYLDEKSYIKGSDFSRISGRVNLEHKVNNWLTVGVNANYSNTQSNYTATAGTTNSMFAFTQGIAPIYPVYQRNGDGSYILNEKGEPILDYGVANGKNRPYSMGSNPFLDILYNVHDNESDVINLRGFADVKLPIKGLTFHINGAMDNIASYETDFQTPIVGDAAAVNGRSTKYAGRMRNITASQRLNYFREFDKWNISLMAGHESLRRQSQGLQAQMTNFFIPDNNEFSNGVTPGMDPASSKSRYSLESYFGRAEVSILDRYSVSASYRRDGSSKFHPDKRWGDFWSVGAAWRLSEEEFFQTSVLRDYVDNFKVKASYGTQGNDAIGGDYALYLDQFSVSNVDGKPGITLSYRGNPDLTWEKSTNFNVGFESSFLKNRLMLEFDYFIKVTSDMLFSRRLAPSLGAPNAIADNGMEMQNEGVEMTLTGVLMKKKNFKWNASLNLTHYKNTINELEPGKEPSGYQNGSYWRKVGGGLYDYYMVKFAGVDPQTGDALYYQDVEKTGVVSDAEGNPVLDANGNKQYYNYTETITTKDANSATKYELGKTSIPDVYGGLSTSFEAYGFDLSISTAFQWGGYCYDGTYGGLMGSNAGSNYHIDMFKRWQKPGDITNVPKLENGNMNMTGGVTNDRFLTSSDYFSLKNVQLGYTFPKNLLKKFGNIESLRVYVVGDNLFLGARRYGLDPRQSLSGATSSDSYSAMRTFSFGVNLAF
jgi:TonB-linked SusC/RagA family outer membrane protein